MACNVGSIELQNEYILFSMKLQFDKFVVGIMNCLV